MATKKVFMVTDIIHKTKMNGALQNAVHNIELSVVFREQDYKISFRADGNPLIKLADQITSFLSAHNVEVHLVQNRRYDALENEVDSIVSTVNEQMG